MNKMKSKNKFQLALFLTLAIAFVWAGCSDDEDAKPFVRYIRVTEPKASDSLLVAAGQGQMIAIMGGNLKNVQQVWFNDRSATLIPTLITNSTVIVRVPSQIPGDITNEMKLVFGNGETLIHNFSVDINEPAIARMKSEYVNDGDEAVIFGDYFYAPVTVTFPGGMEGEVVSVTDTEIHVTVPDGAEPGPITVSSNFGTTESTFWFRDNRNIIADFDGPLISWTWRGSEVVVASDPEVENINGKFMRVNRGQQAAWPYMELYGGPQEEGGDIANVTKNLPEGALLNPSGYVMKFEINTLQTLAGGTFRIYIGNANNAQFADARNNTFYEWQANEDTQGQWQTVTLPWAPIYEANDFFNFSSFGYGMYIYCHGPNAAIYNFALDNIRVVPAASN